MGQKGFRTAIAIVSSFVVISTASAQHINGDAPLEGYYITNWFSEEGTAQELCPDGYAVKGIECSGDYCDNKRLYCWPLTPLQQGFPVYNWGEWFSEEAYSNSTFVLENYHVGGFQPVTGMQCSGHYCDNIRLEKVMVFGAGVLVNQCQQTPFFSEETGGVGNIYVCPLSDRYVAGVSCLGSYCDNISLYCCQMN